MKTLYKTQIKIILVFFATFGLYAQTPGSLDTSFDIGTGFNNNPETITLQPDGKILVGGWFVSYNGTNQNRIVQLNTDGSLDTSFDIGNGFNQGVLSTALQPDGKILVGGAFIEYNWEPQNRIIRLNTDGSLDDSFNIGTGFNNLVFSIAVQPDGKIIIGGGFTAYNGTTQNRIVRLNANGSLDTSFNIGTGFNNAPETITLQPDGKILVGGRFTDYNGTTQNRIIRLNSNGSIDTSFSIGTGFNNNFVRAIVVQPDGKILVGGDFTAYNGTNQNRIVRLNTNGTLDTSFTVGTGLNIGAGEAIILQPDGKIIIGGGFTTYNGTAQNRIARLNTDGSLDTSFNIGAGFNGGSPSTIIVTMAMQPDGKILAGGYFTEYDGTPQNYITRLHGDTSAGIEELKPLTVNTYPNPTTDYFNITSQTMIQSVELYDVSGRLVRTSIVNGFETKQNVSNLTNRIYILKIKTNKGEVTGKIVKK